MARCHVILHPAAGALPPPPLWPPPGRRCGTGSGLSADGRARVRGGRAVFLTSSGVAPRRTL
eukprot:11138652-Prorocentrum_lima.AAC.1